MTPYPCARLNRFARWWIARNPVQYHNLRDDLIAVNMGVTLDCYVIRALLTSTLFGLIWAVAGFLAMRFSTFPGISIRVHNVFAVRLPAFVLTDTSVLILNIVESVVIFVIAAYATLFFFRVYPSLLKKNRAAEINLLLHNAVAYIYAMRRGGTEVMEIFRSVARETRVYGEVAHEFRRVVRDTDYFGYDMISAIRHLQETTPSDKLRDFLQDLISVVESGGDVTGFLDVRVRMYQEEARFEQKGFLNTLQMAAEVYVTLFVAGPLFIIIVMLVMGLVSDTSVTYLSAIIYLLIPAGSLFFILFIDAISIKTGEVERYTVIKQLRTFEDVRVSEQEDEDPLARKLLHYDRVRNIRFFLCHPFQAFLVEPNRTLYVTVPIALVYIAFTLFVIPAYPDPEVLIDILDDHLVIALLIVLIPFGIFHYLWQKRAMAIEAGIPDFLDRLAGINQVGLTLVQAITILVRANLGMLSYEIRKIKRDLEWGVSIQEALIRFEERIRTPAIARTVTLITKASLMTSDIGDVLAIAARDATMSEVLKRERQAEMFIYTLIVYLVFIVFLFVVIVIDTRFLSMVTMIDAPTLTGVTGSGPIKNIAIVAFERLLYHACLIQAFFSGLIAGAMGEASLRAGVKHAAAMIVIAFVVFAVFL